MKKLLWILYHILVSLNPRAIKTRAGKLNIADSGVYGEGVLGIGHTKYARTNSMEVVPDCQGRVRTGYFRVGNDDERYLLWCPACGETSLTWKGTGSGSW